MLYFVLLMFSDTIHDDLYLVYHVNFFRFYTAETNTLHNL